MSGAAEELWAMAQRRELEQIEPNVDRAQKLLKDAERSLKTARSIAPTDPKSALLLAWDGDAFPTLAAALAIAGYRVTHQIGHHRVAVEAARHLLSANALLSRIGALRRMRDRGMYESEPADKEEIAAALDDSQALIHIVRRAVEKARGST